jgi:hypothetical protein
VYDIPDLANGESPISQTGEQFDIYYDKDLTALSETLTVTVKAISESKYTTDSAPVEVTGTFTVNFDNPCID